MRRQQQRRRCIIADLDQSQGSGVAPHDRMGIRASEAERIDACQRRSAPFRQPPIAVHDPQVEFVERDVRARRFLMKGRRHHPMVQRQDGLQHAGEAGHRFEVSDIRLHRADRQRLRSPLPQALAQGIRLDRIADPGARAVCLDEKQVRGIDGEIAIDLIQQSPLRVRRRYEHTGGVAVLVHARADKHGVDAIACLMGRRHRAQYHDDGALRSHVSVGRRVEWPAQAGRRQHRGARKSDIGEGRQQQIHTAHDRRVDRAVADRLRGEVKGYHRRRARRVERQAGAAQIQRVGQPIRHDAQGIARHHVDVGRRWISEESCRVIDRRGTDVDAGIAARQARGPNAGMGQCVVSDLQEVAVLRVDLLGLARAHPECRGVEAPDVVDHTGCERIAATDLVGRGVVVGLSRKAIGRDPADAAVVVPQEMPQLFDASCARHTTGIADDRDFAS